MLNIRDKAFISRLYQTMLEINGIKVSEERENRFKTKQCNSCRKLSSKEARICQFIFQKTIGKAKYQGRFKEQTEPS